MTRGIKTGISSMIEAINESMAEASVVQKFDKESVQKILNDLAEDPGKWLKDENSVNWVQSGILEMMTPALERLLRQIERTLEYYTASVGYEKVDKVYFSSVPNVFYYPLFQYISEHLVAKSEMLDPFQSVNASASGASLSRVEKRRWPEWSDWRCRTTSTPRMSFLPMYIRNRILPGG